MKKIIMALVLSIILSYLVLTFGMGLTLAMLGSFIMLAGIMIFMYTLFVKEEEEN